MPTMPTSRDLHVDQLLTNVSIGYKNSLYIEPEVFPELGVQKRSDIVPKYDQSPWFRNLAAIRAPGTKSQGGGFSVDNTDTYFAHRYSFRFEVDDDTRDNADAPYDLDRDGAMFVSDKMMLLREILLSTGFFKTGVWTDKTAGVDFTVWSNYAASTPLVDVTNFMDTMEGLIAYEPNRLVIGKQVWQSLRWHPDVLDLIKGGATTGNPALATVEMVANMMGVERLLVGRAIYTTSPEGTAEASVTYTRVWGKNGLLLYVPPRASLMTPSAGYAIVWNRIANARNYVKRMRDEERETDIIEGNTYLVHKATAVKSGVFLSGAVA